MLNIIIESISEIDKILDFIHDEIFDLPEVNFNKELGEVTIPINVALDKNLLEKKTLFIKRWKSPVVNSILRIRNVLSLEIDDRDGIQQGCISNFSYSNPVLVINNSIPVEFRIAVKSLHIGLEFSDDIIKLKSRFSLGL